MEKLFLFCTLSSFMSCGMFIAFNGPNMILNSVAFYLDLRCPAWLRAPLYECLSCMASVWTIVLWLILKAAAIDCISPALLIPAIIITCGMNTVVAYPVSKLLSLYSNDNE
jgi:hypothetical protein